MLEGSVVWRLQRISADGRALVIHYNEYRGREMRSTEQVGVYEDDDEVKIRVDQRIVFTGEDWKAVFLGEDHAVQLRLPLGTRRITHAPVSESMKRWGTVEGLREPFLGDAREGSR